MSDAAQAKGCGCMTAAQTGTISGYTCAWHRERHMAAVSGYQQALRDAAEQTAALRALVGREHRDRLGKSYSAHRVAFLMDSNLCDVCALLADPGSDKPC